MTRRTAPVSIPAAFVLALSLAACSPGSGDAGTATAPAADAATTTVTHPQGETRIGGVPGKVLVTDWAAFDNLAALGVPVAGVPGGIVPPYLAGQVDAGALRLGSLQEPDIEAIAAAKPDLVVVAARSRTAWPQLSKLAPTIDMSIDNADIIGGLRHNLETYGRVFGREAEATALLAALDAKIAEARAAAAGKGTALIVVTHGGRMGVYGRESRVSWIYSALDVRSVFDDVDDRDHGGDAITAEYLLKSNPDWLFVIDRDAGVGQAGSAHQLLDNPLVHGAAFWKNDRVIQLDPQAAYLTMHGYGAVMLLLDQVIAGYGRG